MFQEDVSDGCCQGDQKRGELGGRKTNWENCQFETEVMLVGMQLEAKVWSHGSWLVEGSKEEKDMDNSEVSNLGNWIIWHRKVGKWGWFVLGDDGKNVGVKSAKIKAS